MFKGMTQRLILGVTAVSIAASNAMAVGNITVPTADYSDVYALAGVAIGIAVVVMLVKKGKSLFS